MTIHLPKELESRIEAAVHGGHYASLDDAMAEAVRLLLRDLKHRPQPPADELTPDPIIGSMRDAADELDEIVADAYRKRREDKGRVFDISPLTNLSPSWQAASRASWNASVSPSAPPIR